MSIANNPKSELVLHAGSWHYKDCPFPTEDWGVCNCPDDLKPSPPEDWAKQIIKVVLDAVEDSGYEFDREKTVESSINAIMLSHEQKIREETIRECGKAIYEKAFQEGWEAHKKSLKPRKQ